MKQREKKRSNEGFGYLEGLIAAVLVTVVFSSAYKGVIVSISSLASSKHHTAALYAAQQQIEGLRAVPYYRLAVLTGDEAESLGHDHDGDGQAEYQGAGEGAPNYETETAELETRKHTRSGRVDLEGKQMLYIDGYVDSQDSVYNSSNDVVMTKAVTLSDNGTSDTSDDIVGQLKVYAEAVDDPRDGLADADKDNMTDDYLKVAVVVTWTFESKTFSYRSTDALFYGDQKTDLDFDGAWGGKVGLTDRPTGKPYPSLMDPQFVADESDLEDLWADEQKLWDQQNELEAELELMPTTLAEIIVYVDQIYAQALADYQAAQDAVQAQKDLIDELKDLKGDAETQEEEDAIKAQIEVAEAQKKLLEQAEAEAKDAKDIAKQAHDHPDDVIENMVKAEKHVLEDLIHNYEDQEHKYTQYQQDNPQKIVDQETKINEILDKIAEKEANGDDPTGEYDNYAKEFTKKAQLEWELEEANTNAPTAAELKASAEARLVALQMFLAAVAI